LIVVVGPCSVHDPAAAREYAARLKDLAIKLRGELLLVMRVYFEKPRTTVGWKGLLNDPELNNSNEINKGLRIARSLLLDINSLGVPWATEFVDPITPQFIADLISWAAIGARTVESQTHRTLASGLSCPVGFKNSTTGNVQTAVDAIVVAAHKHSFLGITKQGVVAIFSTTGNPLCHVVLRGGESGPNYTSDHISDACQRLQKANLCCNIMIDCSHGNSQKDYKNQPKVAASVVGEILNNNKDVIGIMVESNLLGGRQDLTDDPKNLVYGVSITDACLSWEETTAVLLKLAEAKRTARTVSLNLSPTSERTRNGSAIFGSDQPRLKTVALLREEQSGNNSRPSSPDTRARVERATTVNLEFSAREDPN